MFGPAYTVQSCHSEFVSRKQNVFNHKGAEIGIAEMLLLR
jgi:hypothetical protein